MWDFFQTNTFFENLLGSKKFSFFNRNVQLFKRLLKKYRWKKGFLKYYSAVNRKQFNLYLIYFKINKFNSYVYGMYLIYIS